MTPPVSPWPANRSRYEIAQRHHRYRVLIALVLALWVGAALPGAVVRANSPVVWLPTSSMATPRLAATATLLPTGTVLVTGGFDANDNALDSAELYNPSTGA